MNKVEQFIASRCKETITKYQKQMDCKHVWYIHGHGYKCDGCDFYTGMNTELNAMVEEQFAEEKMTLKNAIAIMRSINAAFTDLEMKALQCLVEDAENRCKE